MEYFGNLFTISVSILSPETQNTTFFQCNMSKRDNNHNEYIQRLFIEFSKMNNYENIQTYKVKLPAGKISLRAIKQNRMIKEL